MWVAPPPPKFLRRGDKAKMIDEDRNGVDAYLLELLDGSLVDTTALVDQVA